ncbi:30S ribosomal protein S27ae [Candidatus Pacearchaeota archaeon CG10_big_fil_rev_8_21_14_0_10_35_13]|nr:MAG: 30S ribosomal protein S27ae [Candidatus Pacearchaeota archaeon CG10_big_fil_rev_8_21_14_0_10_35_13]
MAKKKGSGVKKGKKPHKNKPTSKKYKMFKIEGEKITRQRNCPRCGPGVFLAKREGRVHCGKCSYTEFIKTETKK